MTEIVDVLQENWLRHLPWSSDNPCLGGELQQDRTIEWGAVRQWVNKGGAAFQIDNQTDTSHNQTQKAVKWSPVTGLPAFSWWKKIKCQHCEKLNCEQVYAAFQALRSLTRAWNVSLKKYNKTFLIKRFILTYSLSLESNTELFRITFAFPGH